MKVWLLGHYYADNNMGDEAIHRQVKADIRSIVPDVEFVGEKDDPDILILGGGGMYSDWQPEAFDTWLPPIERTIRREKKIPIVAYGIGVGPLFNPQKKARIQTVFSDIDLIMVRDEFSKQQLGMDRVFVTADSAVRYNEGRLLAGVNFVEIKTIPGIEDLAVRIVKHLSEFFTVQIFNFWQPHLQFAKRICEKALGDNDVIFLMDVSDPAAALKAIRTVDYYVGMQYHGCMFAAMNGIKTLSLSYHPKCCELAKRMNLPEVIIGDGKNLPATNLVEVSYAIKEAIDQQIIVPLRNLRNRSEANKIHLQQFLEARRMI